MNDGGLAFPNSNASGSVHNDGMSLRDWFAGQALAGLATQSDNSHNIAIDAYSIADAMLKRREVEPT